jgi:hypothetical protein
VDDYLDYADCLAGPGSAPSPTGMTAQQCLDIFDVDDDTDVDFRDFARLQALLTVPTFTAEYELVFEATWSAATHPNDFPPNPHFSGLIGGTHDDGVSIWEVGGIASTGMESMAEIGSKTALTAEVQAAITAGTAGELISGPGVSVSPGTASVVFTATQDHPLVSVVTMIAPSPDWFVGVSAYPLFQNGQWADEVVIPLPPFDAGTDSGVTYTSPNADVTPHEPITEITGWPLAFDGTVAPLGTFRFRRLP